ncbi:Arc family DNA-binding protein [Rhizobium ruizarguesonis]
MTLRMPAALRDHLADGAAKVGRSLNAEIVARLSSENYAPGLSPAGWLLIEMTRHRKRMRRAIWGLLMIAVIGLMITVTGHLLWHYFRGDFF